MLAEPTVLFLKSLAVGAVLGFYYDLFYALRLLFPGKWNLHIPLDILYCVFTGVIAFRYILYENMGKVRFFILLGILLGWVLYHFTVSRVLVKLINLIFELLKQLVTLLLKPVSRRLRELRKRAGERPRRKCSVKKKRKSSAEKTLSETESPDTGKDAEV